MSKFAFTAILLVGLVGSASMQNFPDSSMGMQQGQGLLSGLFGGNTNYNGAGTGGLGETIRQLPARGMEMLNSVFSGVRNILPNLGRNNNYPMNNMSQYQQGGPLGGLMNQLSSTLNMQNPMQNMQNQMQNPMQNMQNRMQGAMNNMQNQMPNMQNEMQNMQNQMPNMQNQMQNMQNPLSNLLNRANSLTNLNGITRPVTDALSQGRIPNVNEVTQGLSKTVSDAVSNLGNQASSAVNV